MAAALTMSLLAKSKIFSVCYKSLSEQQFKKLTGVDQAAWSTCMDLESKKFLRIYQQEFRRAISRQLDFAARVLWYHISNSINTRKKPWRLSPPVTPADAWLYRLVAVKLWSSLIFYVSRSTLNRSFVLHLVLAPRIVLVNQLFNEYRRFIGKNYIAVAFHSGRKEQDYQKIQWQEAKATTHLDNVSAEKDRANLMKKDLVIFCTHSLEEFFWYNYTIQNWFRDRRSNFAAF